MRKRALRHRAAGFYLTEDAVDNGVVPRGGLSRHFVPVTYRRTVGGNPRPDYRPDRTGRYTFTK
jgi:hypothetical protein